MNIFIIEFFLILAGTFSALHDLVVHEKLIGLGVWFNPRKSWRFKYRNGEPTHGERFVGSTTIFVFITDAFHLTKFLYNSCWQLLLAIYLNYTYYLLDFIDHVSGVCLYKLVNQNILLLLNFLLIKSFFNVIFENVYSQMDRRVNKRY